MSNVIIRASCIGHLISPIDNNCRPSYVDEIEGDSAYIFPKDIVKATIGDDGYATIEITDPSFDLITNIGQRMDNPFNARVESSRNKYGIVKYQKRVDILFLNSSPVSELQIKQLEAGKYVLLTNAIKDAGRVTMAFGLETGLSFEVSSEDHGSTDTHGGIIVTMLERDCNIPMVFHKWFRYK